MNIFPIVFLSLASLVATTLVQGAEHRVGGIIDLRASFSDTLPSYLDGNFGKFAQGNGSTVALSQAALVYNGTFDSGLGIHITGNAYVQNTDASAGLSEAYLLYKTLPSASGFRLDARAGRMYPHVSLENVQTAWSSPYTLDFSTINSWLAEEVRHRGVEVSLTRLGSFTASNQDLTLGLALYQGNDPTGAMLAWHGWVLSNRQSLLHQTLPLPDLAPTFVPAASDAFRELDHRIGYHAFVENQWHEKGTLLIGYYDNNADAKVVKDNQWAWATRFAHVGFKWKLAGDLELLGQYLTGDTLMEAPGNGFDLVFNDFHSAFVLLSKSSGRHRWSARLEEFAVLDRDTMRSDLNREYGKAATLSYRYRLSSHWFMQGEYSLIQSTRAARRVAGFAEKLREEQVQVAVQYLF
jgi:hypothetical protein